MYISIAYNKLAPEHDDLLTLTIKEKLFESKEVASARIMAKEKNE